MSSQGNGYRWLPLIKQAQLDLNCSNEEDLRLKLLNDANKSKLLATIQARQNSAPGKIAVAHVDGLDGSAKSILSKLYPHLTVAQQFAAAQRELRFPDLPCLLVRIHDDAQPQHLPLETVMTRVDLSQRRMDPLPWMLSPPPIAKEIAVPLPAPLTDKAEQILKAIHDTRGAVNHIRDSVSRLADAAETEAVFISKNRQHLLNQVKRLEEDLKAKEGVLQELKAENRHLQEALNKGKEDGYPTLSEDLVDSAAKSARNRTPSTSEFGDILSIAEDEVVSTSDGDKATGRGKRKSAKAEAAPSAKKGNINVPGTVA